jgi:hypothetical protein
MPAGEAAHRTVLCALDQRLGRRNAVRVEHLLEALQALAVIVEERQWHA